MKKFRLTLTATPGLVAFHNQAINCDVSEHLQCFDRRSLNAAEGTVPAGPTDIWETWVLWNSEGRNVPRLDIDKEVGNSCGEPHNSSQLYRLLGARKLLLDRWTRNPLGEKRSHFLLICSRRIVRFPGPEIPHSKDLKCQPEKSGCVRFSNSSVTLIIPPTLSMTKIQKNFMMDVHVRR